MLTRLEAKTFGPHGSVGLNLTRATLDACTKYPWTRALASDPGGVHADGTPRFVVKFGVYDDDLEVFDWLRQGIKGTRKCLEAQVMDLADDVAYSVHDVEDGIVADRLDLTRLDLDALWETVRAWYLPDSDDAELLAAPEAMRARESWPRSPYDGSRRSLAAIKNLTSDLVGRFCGSVQSATFAASDGPFVRHRADLVVPRDTEIEIGILKGIAAHYVMQARDRVDLMERQRQLMSELFEALWKLGPDGLDPSFVDDWQVAGDDDARRRVIVDRVASYTDARAINRHTELTTG
ncbi:hypothetical protein [Nocardioides sp. B-3]|uniref:hypothetical protein n=1 Tax=Nocardioides sp. B-3 TaxID=2895565 RepID=UPI0021533E5D|nr:hypothetical protein [Nocardioides sp. B-3]UUZ58560.1 hypothetical protein LP418_20735 [Nocardioides sp. B-3]